MFDKDKITKLIPSSKPRENIAPALRGSELNPLPKVGLPITKPDTTKAEPLKPVESLSKMSGA